ncbi:hypothetical protein [Halomonas sp. 707B3]|uniref:hypothetical protein n=1 Tax=Halomonas sp. 707B3 TaxID=1681043 RepID=UPI00209FC995|nr:hypothetical protein [Halomonas sp. 707B3]MCP1316405.1 hypothetical protein [Halomonas sp. 707B3]
MSHLHAVPDQNAVRFPQFLAEADKTPTDCIEEGERAACNSLIRWAQQPENEHWLCDIFFERNATSRRDAAIAEWDKQVRSGEWV